MSFAQLKATMKKQFMLLSFALVVVLSLSALAQGQATFVPAPTLVPPTLVPTQPVAPQDFVLAESGVARIVRDGTLRVGVLYNESPFGEINVRGELSGFDPDLARLLAETWGVELELVQVTRQNRLEVLRSGQIDLLIAAQVQSRELDGVLEFSEPYRLSRQAMLVRADDSAETLFNMAGRRVAYVAGTEGERALAAWQARTGISFSPVSFLTLDQAYSALFGGAVDGVVGRFERLRRVASGQLDAVRFLEEAVAREPFAVAMARQDIQLRQLVNRTLQYLTQEGKLNELHTRYFPGERFPTDALALWQNIGEDAPTPNQFNLPLEFPAQYAVPRIRANGVVRVAGLLALPPEASDGERRLDSFHRAVVEQMAARWGVRVEYVSDGDFAEAVELGNADIAAGMVLDWTLANRLDFSQPYALRGDRLMVKSGSNITGFNEIRGRWVGIMNSDAGAQERAQEWADSINARVRFYSTTEQEAASAMLIENNAEVIYGDSLKLIPHLLANPDTLRLTERWYSRIYMGFGVPSNDLDLRLLVDYTLQAMIEDGTLRGLLATILPPNSEMPVFNVMPGTSSYLGLAG